MARTDVFDLGSLHLSPGEGRRLTLSVEQGALTLAGQTYEIGPPLADATLEVSRLLGGGYALALALAASLHGPCMRCLAEASPALEVDAREVDVPGEGDELDSPYVEGDLLDVRRWAHDAVALAAPSQVLCAPDCLGLCPVCAVALAHAGPDHRHAAAPDPRWEKLRELRLE
jgi:uncharacterized protein